MLARDRAEYVRHLAQIEATVASVDWPAHEQRRSSRLTIEFGRRFYTMQIEWTDWAAGQIAADALQPGGPPPGGPGPGGLLNA